MKLHRLFVFVASLSMCGGTAVAQGVSASAEVRSSVPLSPLPATCVPSASTTCRLPLPGDPLPDNFLELTASAGASRPPTLIGGATSVFGTLSLTGASFSAKTHSELTDRLTVVPLSSGAPLASDVVFTGYFFENRFPWQIVLPLDVTFSTRITFSFLVGERGTTFEQVRSTSGDATTGGLVLHVPYEVFADGAAADLDLVMDTELELSTGLIPGVRTFRASANAPGVSRRSSSWMPRGTTCRRSTMFATRWVSRRFRNPRPTRCCWWALSRCERCVQHAFNDTGRADELAQMTMARAVAETKDEARQIASAG
jgi:hypothetical protein